MKFIKNSIVFLSVLAIFYVGYSWDKSTKLDDYFAEQFSLDWELQVLKGDPGHEGPIFKQAYEEMKELGYNPYEIQQIIFKGFDRGNVKLRKQEIADERYKAYVNKKSQEKN